MSSKRSNVIGVVKLGLGVAAVTGCAFFAGCGSAPGTEQVGTAQDELSGAGFTTFDQTLRGCLDSPNGIDCNNYVAKEDVFVSGGPVAAGLANGSYFFAVLVPGFQNGGFIDGANGNLSDQTAGSTSGDLGSGDAVLNRTFTVTNHLISSYNGSHNLGTINGKLIIQLVPYDDTSNNGGVYILAVCEVGAISPSQCKYDAFKVRTPTPPPPDAGPDVCPPPPPPPPDAGPDVCVPAPW